MTMSMTNATSPRPPAFSIDEFSALISSTLNATPTDLGLNPRQSVAEAASGAMSGKAPHHARSRPALPPLSIARSGGEKEKERSISRTASPIRTSFLSSRPRHSPSSPPVAGRASAGPRKFTFAGLGPSSPLPGNGSRRPSLSGMHGSYPDSFFDPLLEARAPITPSTPGAFFPRFSPRGISRQLERVFGDKSNGQTLSVPGSNPSIRRSQSCAELMPPPSLPTTSNRTPGSTPPQRPSFSERWRAMPLSRSTAKLPLPSHSYESGSRAAEPSYLPESSTNKFLSAPFTTWGPQRAKSSPGSVSIPQGEKARSPSQTRSHLVPCRGSPPRRSISTPALPLRFLLRAASGSTGGDIASTQDEPCAAEITRVLTPDEDPFAKADVVPVTFFSPFASSRSTSTQWTSQLAPRLDDVVDLLSPMPLSTSPRSALSSLSGLHELSTPVENLEDLRPSTSLRSSRIYSSSLRPPPSFNSRSSSISTPAPQKIHLSYLNTIKGKMEKQLPPVPSGKDDVAAENNHKQAVNRIGRTLFIPPSPPRRGSTPFLSVSSVPDSRTRGTSRSSGGPSGWLTPRHALLEPEERKPGLRARLGSAFKFGLGKRDRSPAVSTDSSFVSPDAHRVEASRVTPAISQGTDISSHRASIIMPEEGTQAELENDHHRRGQSTYGAEIASLSPLLGEQTPTGVESIASSAMPPVLNLACSIEKHDDTATTARRPVTTYAAQRQAPRKGTFPFEAARPRGLGELDLMFTARASTPSSLFSASDVEEATSFATSWDESSMPSSADTSSASELLGSALGLDIGSERPLFTDPWAGIGMEDSADSSTLASSEGTEESVVQRAWPLPPKRNITVVVADENAHGHTTTAWSEVENNLQFFPRSNRRLDDEPLVRHKIHFTRKASLQSDPGESSGSGSTLVSSSLDWSPSPLTTSVSDLATFPCSATIGSGRVMDAFQRSFIDIKHSPALACSSNVVREFPPSPPRSLLPPSPRTRLLRRQSSATSAYYSAKSRPSTADTAWSNSGPHDDDLHEQECSCVLEEAAEDDSGVFVDGRPLGSL